MRRRSSLLAAAIAWTGCAASGPIDRSDRAIDLAPREPAGWSISRLLAPASWMFSSVRRRWYAPRILAIETSPPGASLDLFYLRRNRQQRLEHAQAPARVRLPAKVDAASRDVVVIRALLDGYREREVRVAARGDVDRIELDLEPLPNVLERIALKYFHGRASLEFRAREKLAFRVNRSERGVRVVLLETAVPPAAEVVVTGSASPLVDEIAVQSLGRDLAVSVALTDRGRADAGEPRLRESSDPVRGWHILAVDLAAGPPDPSELERAETALAHLTRRSVIGCALEYDRALRADLELEDPAPMAAATDDDRGAFVRAAMTRLAALSPGGAIRMVDGRVLRAVRPVEVSAAAADAGGAVGFLALLRTAVEVLEAPSDRRAALQSLLAPELSAAAFGAALDRAEAAERACVGSRR